MTRGYSVSVSGRRSICRGQLSRSISKARITTVGCGDSSMSWPCSISCNVLPPPLLTTPQHGCRLLAAYGGSQGLSHCARLAGIPSNGAPQHVNQQAFGIVHGLSRQIAVCVRLTGKAHRYTARMRLREPFDEVLRLPRRVLACTCRSLSCPRAPSSHSRSASHSVILRCSVRSGKKVSSS